MDPKTIEINNLRVLNDYLNQTIDALTRFGQVGGLGHSAYTPFGGGLWGGMGGLGYGAGVGGVGMGGVGYGLQSLHPAYAAASMTGGLGGLTHSGIGMPDGGVGNGWLGGVGGIGGLGGIGGMGGMGGFAPYGAMGGVGYGVPFGFGSRGLDHTGYGASQWQLAEIVRRNQIAQAVAARQSVLEAIARAAGIPV